MPSLNKTFDLKGKICAARAENNIIVLELQGIRKGDVFKDLELVDKLDLRSSLVQYSHENRAVANDDATAPEKPGAEPGKLYNVILDKKQ